LSPQIARVFPGLLAFSPLGHLKQKFGDSQSNPNLFSMASFDIDNNCQKSSDSLFEVIEELYTDNDFKTDLSGFISELKKSYIIFNHMWDIRIKPDLENIYSGMQNKISIMKRELIVESGVPEGAINFVLKSAELRKLSYFLIKIGFKCGFFLCLAYNTLHMQLSEEVGNYLPGVLNFEHLNFGFVSNFDIRISDL
jgi:hypothetical protein